VIDEEMAAGRAQRVQQACRFVECVIIGRAWGVRLDDRELRLAQHCARLGFDPLADDGHRRRRPRRD
jgi:hypothetical protein